MALSHIQLFEGFSFSSDDELEGLRTRYPHAIITMTPNEKYQERYFARVDIETQGGEKEYLGALKGPVSREQALEFFKTILSNNYDRFY
jgi:hypothetical protein